MKLKKTSTALAAVLIGAAVFTTSALADVVVGSGYNSLKDAVKTTTRELAGGMDSFTAKVSMALKLDGQTLEEVSDISKVDCSNQKRISENISGDGSTYLYYSDNEQSITKYNNDDTYYVTKYPADYRYENSSMIEDPFATDMAKDAEKVVDAFVGSLKDIVQVEESDGKKQYIGNLTETQVPPVANALFSFVMKYGVLESYDLQEWNLPRITSDIYVKEASGKAIENERGILESAVGTASVVGSDDSGVEHTITLEVAMELTDINNTVVAAPDLTDKKVETHEVSEGVSGYMFDQRYVGVYKNDIIEADEDAFRKVGERVLEITKVENGVIEGRYYERYVDGYTPDAVRDFTFSGTDEMGKNTILNYVDNTDGVAKQAVLHRSGMQGENLMLELGLEFDEDGDYMAVYDMGDYNSEFIRQYAVSYPVSE